MMQPSPRAAPEEARWPSAGACSASAPCECPPEGLPHCACPASDISPPSLAPAASCAQARHLPHPVLLQLGVEPRSLFLHAGCLERLTPSRHGVWDGRCWVALRTSAMQRRRPFWGLRRRVVARFSATGCWVVVLLDGPARGWLVPGPVAEGLILARRWHLARDDEYKITPPLPGAWRFEEIEQARALLSRLS